MSKAFNPGLDVLVKLGSIAVHAEELLSPTGTVADRFALSGVVSDPEVREWLEEMSKMALLPVKRSA